MSDAAELRELQARLQGALADLETERGTVAALRIALRDADAKLEFMTAQHRRLVDEKNRFWHFSPAEAERDILESRPMLVQDDDPEGDAGDDPALGHVA